MGAWGINTFENDGALDWLGDFRDSPHESKIIQTFSPQTPPPKTGFFSRLFGGASTPVSPELEGDEILAAAEVVATLRGRPPATLPDDLKDLPDVQISNETVTLALKAVDSVLETSNLRDCWEETDEYPSWKSAVADIRHRLSMV